MARRPDLNRKSQPGGARGLRQLRAELDVVRPDVYEADSCLQGRDGWVLRYGLIARPLLGQNIIGALDSFHSRAPSTVTRCQVRRWFENVCIYTRPYSLRRDEIFVDRYLAKLQEQHETMSLNTPIAVNGVRTTMKTGRRLDVELSFKTSDGFDLFRDIASAKLIAAEMTPDHKAWPSAEDEGRITIGTYHGDVNSNLEEQVRSLGSALFRGISGTLGPMAYIPPPSQ